MAYHGGQDLTDQRQKDPGAYFTDQGADGPTSGALLEEGLRTAATLIPLKTLKPNFLRYLFANAQVQTMFPGQVLFKADDYDRQHVYLLHGCVELQYSDGRTEMVNGGRIHFPLAHQLPRPCGAIARSDCSVLSIDSLHLDQILSWSQIAQYLMAEIAIERDYDEDNGWMQTVLDSNLFFKVPPVNVDKIFSRLTPMVVLKGEVVVRQGEIGDCCYFIKEGTASVTRRPENQFENDSRVEKLADVGVGRCFGEDALVYHRVRNATVTMTSDGVLMRLEKTDFLLLLKEPKVNEVSGAALAEPDAPVLIDVRTEEEYAAGHLEPSANIPLNLLCLKKRLLTADRSYIFYCDTGRRSRAAAYLLGREGYNTAALQDGLAGISGDEKLSQRQDYILRGGELVSSC